MAIMHPKNLNNFDATKSERAMFEALEQQLDNSYHVFYSVTWYTEEKGVRVNSECDFLVFNSNYGFLTIEVKGGTKIEVEEGEWTLYAYNKHGEIESRKLTKSPYKQAESSMHYFRKYYKKETLTNFRGTFGMAVAFPFFYVDVDMENDAPKELTIQLKDMKNLESN
ncbi:MAG: NERD domain-containing protein [Lachnospiraceae bacterium]|nr:NERD domain-containing protein [Lachnospiraceae bacterium]